MQVRISSGPAYAIAYVTLNAGESVYLEKGAMVAVSGGISASFSAADSAIGAALRKILVDEKFFQGLYTASVTGAWVAAAPAFPGDVAVIDVGVDGPLTIQSGAYLGHEPTVNISVGVTSAQKVIMREGLFAMNCNGHGLLLIASYGGLERFELAQGHKLIVDTGHIVAWSQGMATRTGPMSGVVSSVLTGEGMVLELTGPGIVYLQSRAEEQLKSFLFPARGHDKK